MAGVKKLIAELMQRGYTPDQVFFKTGYKQMPDGEWLNMEEAVRMQRAQEQGYGDQVYYHGTARDGYVESTDIESFDPSKVGDRWSADDSGFFFTNKKSFASDYASSDRDYTFPGEGQGAVYPVRTRSENPLVIDSQFLRGQGMEPIGYSEDTISFWDNYQGLIRDWVEEGGHDSVILRDAVEKNELGAPIETFVALDPSQVRSTSAAFDPAQRDSARLLAGINPVALAPLAALAGAGYSGESEAGKVSSIKDAANRLMARRIDDTTGAPATEQWFGDRKTLMDALSESDLADYRQMLESRNALQRDFMAERMKMFDSDFKPLDTDEARFASKRADDIAAKIEQAEVDADHFLSSRFLSSAPYNPATEAHALEVDRQLAAAGIDPYEDPAYDYGMILPYRKHKSTGEREFAVPGIARDLLRGITDIGTSRKTGVINPNAMLDTLL